METSLYERLGDEAIDTAVDYLYRKAVADKHISRFFEDVDLDRLRYKQKMFLTMALGGPNKYTGRDLREAHRPLLKWGLDDTHFDRVVEILVDALRHIQVSEEDIEAAIRNLGPLRNDVLVRGASVSETP